MQKTQTPITPCIVLEPLRRITSQWCHGRDNSPYLSSQPQGVAGNIHQELLEASVGFLANLEPATPWVRKLPEQWSRGWALIGICRTRSAGPLPAWLAPIWGWGCWLSVGTVTMLSKLSPSKSALQEKMSWQRSFRLLFAYEWTESRNSHPFPRREMCIIL